MISAVWEWLDDNPESCELLHHHLPGMTTRAVTLQREFEEIHLRRAFDYLPQRPTPASRRSAIGRHAAETLAARTLIGLTILIHPMRSQDGPARRPGRPAGPPGVDRDLAAPAGKLTRCQVSPARCATVPPGRPGKERR